MSVVISPSLLSADFAHLEREVAALEEAGADWLHFDVMDGQFVPNLSIGIPVLKSLRKITKLPIDVHLMVREPDHLLSAFVDAGADTLSVHAEACAHVHRSLQYIRKLGVKAGIVFNPATPTGELDYVRDLLDFVLLMSVNPGYGGQSYIGSVTAKIADVHRRFPDLPIQVDGGIKVDNVEVVARAGASNIVSGSGIFGADNYRERIAEMRRRAEAVFPTH